MKKIKTFFEGVKKEAKRVHWPKGKELIKYSVITVVLIAFFALFFLSLDSIFAFLRGLVK